jgi:general stress protein YciG
MPNTPDRGKQQPGSSEERKRQQLNDSSLEDTNDDETEESGIEAPGIDEDDEVSPLRTEQGGETGEDEDLPDDAPTQVNSNPGNFRNDREKDSDAGRKGGQR